MPNVYQTVFGGNPVAPALPTYLALSFGVNTILGWPLESNITSPAVAEWVDCTATAAALTLQLSDARQVSTGYTAIFNNVGANTFSVLDAQGNTLLAPAPGAAWILVLADNSTLQGTWRTLQLGAGVSSANAAALAGNGLKAIATTLNARIVLNPQAVNYTIGSGFGQDRATCVEWTGGSGGTLASLPAATFGTDWFCYIKNSGTGVVTFVPGSGAINGSVSQTFNPNDSAIIVTDGVNFFTIGLGQSVASSFNFVTISLAGAGPGTVLLAGAQLNRVSYKFTGALAGNVIVQVPASIQQYWVDNETTGAFTLTISAGGAGSTFVVPQGTRTILYCDGLNIVNAISSGAIQFGDGTAAAPSIAFASHPGTGLYLVGPDVIGISTAGSQRVTINASGVVTVNPAAFGGTVVVNAAAAVAAVTLNSTIAATQVYQAYAINSTIEAFTGVAGVANDLVTGSAANDVIIRSQGGAVDFSTNSGTAIALKLLAANGGISGFGPIAAALVDMTPDTGTFPGTLTGCTTAPVGTCMWTRVGKLVLLALPVALSGVSNATTCSITGLPVALQPATLSQWVPVATLINNGVTTNQPSGAIIAPGSNAITFTLTGSAAGFTIVNAKGTPPSDQLVIAYLLN